LQVSFIYKAIHDPTNSSIVQIDVMLYITRSAIPTVRHDGQNYILVMLAQFDLLFICERQARLRSVNSRLSNRHNVTKVVGRGHRVRPLAMPCTADRDKPARIAICFCVI